MTEQELAEIRQRANAATPGPWKNFKTGYTKNGRTDGEALECVKNLEGDITFAIDAVDADFIAHARQDIPALLAEVERLRADIEHVSTVGESLAASLDSVKAYNARLRAALDDMLLLIAEHGTKIMWSHNTRITAARNAPKGGSQ